MHYAQTNLQLYRQVASRPEAERLQLRAAYDAATQLFAGRFRGNGKPFVAHLVGTASVLAADGAPTDLVAAALLHAAYEQGAFDDGGAGATAQHRAHLARAVGANVEALVAAYEASSRDEVPPPEILRMRVANEIDEFIDDGMAYATPDKRALVVAGVPRLLAAARAAGLDRMADELEGLVAAAAEIPAALRSRHTGSYTLATPRPRRLLRIKLPWLRAR